MGQEIERKFLIKEMPELEKYECRHLIQGYLCTNPTIRVRKEDDEYYMTYKGKGHIAKEEYNLPLNKEAFDSLIKKAEGNIISKKRYLIPIGRNEKGNDLTVELDVFDEPFFPLRFAEVEFLTIEEANSFKKPDWLGDDVTDNPEYYNSNMSKKKF